MGASINAVFDGNSENAFHEKEHPNGIWGVSAGYQCSGGKARRIRRILRKGMALQHPEGASGAPEHPGAAMAMAPRRGAAFWQDRDSNSAKRRPPSGRPIEKHAGSYGSATAWIKRRAGIHDRGILRRWMSGKSGMK